MKVQKHEMYLITSLVFAIWFMLTSSFWVYWACLIVSYPFGIASFILWKKNKDVEPKKNMSNFIPIILLIGLLISIVFLIYLLIFD